MSTTRTLSLRAVILSIAVLVVSYPTVAQCIPTWTTNGVSNSNSCSGQTQSCIGSITKLASYEAYFPDGYSGSTALFGSGEVGYSFNCSAGQIVGPYPTTECWPTFFSPQTSQGSFFVSDYDQTAFAVTSCCGSAWCTIAPLKLYVSSILCLASGYHTAEVTHTCSGTCS